MLFSIVSFVLVATGAAMVLGGIYLIASGSLKLAGDKAGRTDVKFGGLFQIATTVPGLGFFVIGLVFQFGALYYVNQARVEDGKLAEGAVAKRIAEAVEADRAAHAMRLAGVFVTGRQQNVRLSVCLGQETTVQSNAPFDIAIGPYLDFFSVRMVTEGAEQAWTVASADRLPPARRNYGARFVSPRDGIADMGEVKLERTVNLDGLLGADGRAAAPPLALPPRPAGGAYGAAQ